MEALSTSNMNPWFTYPFVLAAILVAGLGADALGRAVRRRSDRRGGDQHHVDLGTIRGALIGLLSLMIGFTFSLTLINFEARSKAVLNVATAISTVRDRAGLLPPPHAAAARRLADAFLDSQIAMSAWSVRAADEAPRSWALHAALLKEAGAALAVAPSGTVGSLFVQSVNLLGERLEERLAAEVHQVTPAVFLTLYVLALVSWSFISYAGGLEGHHSRVSNALMATAFTAVVALVDDVDRPNVGVTAPDGRPLLILKAAAPP